MGTSVIRKLLLGAFALTLSLNIGAQTAEPIKVGTTQALTGHYKEFGAEQLNGLKMWVDDVNARGSLLGRRVELVHYDDGSRSRRVVAVPATVLRAAAPDSQAELLLVAVPPGGTQCRATKTLNGRCPRAR